LPEITDAAGFCIAREELDAVLSRKKREARVVFNWPFRKLGGGLSGKLDIHFIAQVADGGAELVLISPIKSISVRSAPPRRASANSRPGFSRLKNEVFGAIELKIVELQGDCQLGHRIVEHEGASSCRSLSPH